MTSVGSRVVLCNISGVIMATTTPSFAAAAPPPAVSGKGRRREGPPATSAGGASASARPSATASGGGEVPGAVDGLAALVASIGGDNIRIVVNGDKREAQQTRDWVDTVRLCDRVGIEKG
jgi:hypothetical protein